MNTNGYNSATRRLVDKRKFGKGISFTKA